MTTYTPYTAAEYAPDAPATADHFRRWFENWIAGFEGATGAPRIYGESLARRGNGLATLTISAADTMTLSNQYGHYLVVSINNTTSTTEVVYATYTMSHYSGSARFKAQHATLTAGTSTLSLYKNGVQVATFTTTSTAYVARSVDVTFAAGDVIEWRHKGSSVSYGSQAGNHSLTASDAYIPQNALIPSSKV